MNQESLDLLILFRQSLLHQRQSADTILHETLDNYIERVDNQIAALQRENPKNLKYHK